MENQNIQLKSYENWLKLEEKSPATIEKYVYNVGKFLKFAGENAITKEIVIQFKEELKRTYTSTGVNGKLAAVNDFLDFIGKGDCRVKNLKLQRQMFLREEKELSRAEYQRLLKAAEGKRIYYIMQTISGTGIRVSELGHITVEAVACGETVVSCKNKIRHIFIPKKTCQMLKNYIKKAGIKTGSVFVSKTGRPLDRTNIWREMKALCKKAGVLPEKVFPHNLRHLFARTFYAYEKDIVRLADVLGHSSIQTTRIYTIETGAAHKKGLEWVQRALNPT